jgi:hypothetical protein
MKMKKPKATMPGLPLALPQGLAWEKWARPHTLRE